MEITIEKMTERAASEDTKLRDAVIKECIANGPIKTTEIIKATGYGRRDIMYAVRSLRMSGVQVCSGDAGYWIWDGQDDTWAATKRQIHSRLEKMATLYAAMERQPIEGQEVLNITEAEA